MVGGVQQRLPSFKLVGGVMIQLLGRLGAFISA
jgi:hypothetical protein